MHFIYLPFADAVPKADFDALKTSFEKLKKKVALDEEKYNNALSEKTQLEENLKKKSEELEFVLARNEQLEEKTSTLQQDLDSARKDSEILDK